MLYAGLGERVKELQPFALDMVVAMTLTVQALVGDLNALAIIQQLSRLLKRRRAVSVIIIISVLGGGSCLHLALGCRCGMGRCGAGGAAGDPSLQQGGRISWIEP